MTGEKRRFAFWTLQIPVCLAAVVDARGAAGWNLINEAPFWVVLPLISVWGAWGLFAVARDSRLRG